MPGLSKSDAIRRLLDADPNATAPAIRGKLAGDGIEVSLDLVRVVRANRRKVIERRQSWRAPTPAPTPRAAPSPAPKYEPLVTTNLNHVVVKVDELAAEELRGGANTVLRLSVQSGGRSITTINR